MVRKKIKVAFCSSEVFPFAKTGGLADVSGSLPFALAKQGCEVKVFMPLYKNITPHCLCDGYGYSKQRGVEFYFIKHDFYFMRDFLYGSSHGDYGDNLERFSFLSKQILGLLKKIDFSPHIVHTNDWQTALINVYLKLHHAHDRFFKHTRSVLTIHNIAYQGVFGKEKYPCLGISWEYFTVRYLEFYDQINLLKGGIVFADMVNTVSPTYARQIQTPEYGENLEGILREKKGRVFGILNAIDYQVWNPAHDTFIEKHYSSKSLDNKSINKRELQKELGFKADEKTFLIGMVSRLAGQKGIDILLECLDRIVGKYQLVILGVGEKKYQNILNIKEIRFHDSFSFQEGFNEPMAHKIYAACDAFLIPSRFEPCGLSQMISYMYATVPIVYRTGGLADTVVDYTQGGGGFVFYGYTSNALFSTIDRAYDVFMNKEEWQKLLKKIAHYNFSWDKTAHLYLEMYKKCVSAA